MRPSISTHLPRDCRSLLGGTSRVGSRLRLRPRRLAFGLGQKPIQAIEIVQESLLGIVQRMAQNADQTTVVAGCDRLQQSEVLVATRLMAQSSIKQSEIRNPSPFVPATTESRSEERRVGKECRSRWSPDQ